MAVNKLLLKRSAVAGKEPTTASLDLGELAINTVDGKVYLKKESGSLQTIVQLADVSGSIFSASYAQTSSFSNNFTVAGPLNVYGNGYISGSLTVTDTITAQRLVVQTITSSIIYSSGSNKFGDATSDTQELTGSVTITGSLGVTGPTSLTGSLIVQNGITGSFSGSLANLQGNPTYIPYFSSSQVLANSAMYQIGTSSIAINETNITVGAPEALYVFQTHPTSINVVTGKGNLNNYLQNNIQNTNQGISASSDVVATANNGDEFTNYIDMGINSENYGLNFVGGPNDAYLYSAGNDLHIGNITPGKPIQFFAGGSDSNVDRKLQLSSNNQHQMTGSLDISGSTTANSFITRGATAAQFVKGDGSLDSTVYVSASVFNSTTGSLNNFSASILVATASLYNATASLYNATASIYNATASIYNATASLYLATQSLYEFSASINTYTSSNNDVITQLYKETASLQAATASIYNATASIYNATASLYRATSSLYNATASLYNFSASILNFTASQLVLNGTYATTGSNIFKGNQTISGSLTVSGSTNVFGTTNLTGSVNVSGSIGTAIIANADTIVFTGSYAQSGSVNINGNITASNALIGGRDYITDSSSFSTRVFNLEQTSASILAATASLYNATASLYNFSASILNYTSSNNAVVAQLYNETASLKAATASLYSATASLYLTTQSLYEFSASINSYTASNNAVITQLYNETASLKAATSSLYLATASIYNTTQSLYEFSASINSYTSSNNAIITQLYNETASLKAATASLYAATASIYNFSASILSYTSSNNEIITQLYNETSSLKAATASLYAATASIYNATQSLYAFSASILAYTASQNILNGTFATTGSNIFIGNQTITGSVFVTGSQSIVGNLTVTDTITAQKLVVQTISSSVIYSSGSNVFGDELTDVQSFTGSVEITGSLTVNGRNYLNDSSSFSTRVFNLEETSASVLLATASLYAATASIYNATASLYNFSASINSYTASNNAVITQLYNETASLKAATSSLYAATASIYNTTQSLYEFSASINSYTASNNAVISQLYNETASLKAATASLYSATASIYLTTQSLYEFSASINSYTASNNAVISQLYNETASLKAATASLYAATASIYLATQSLYEFSASINAYTSSNNNVISQLYNETASLKAATASLYSATASLYNFSASILSYTASNNDIITQLYNETSSLKAATASLYTFSASINSFTASQLVLNGTYATTGSNVFRGNQTVTGSLFTSGSNTLVGSTTLSGSVDISGSTTITGTTIFRNSSTTITGSLLISGSTTQIGNNTLLGNTTLSGSIIISGSNGPGSSTASVQIYGDIRQAGYHRFDPVTTNIDNSISASYIYVSGSTNDLYFTQNGGGYGNTTRLRWLEGNLYTGLLNGGLITITTGSTWFNLSSGSGIIVDLNASLTDNPYPTIKYVNWGNFISQSITFLTSSIQSYIGIDENGQITQQTTPYVNGEFNTKILIGTVLHQNQTTVNASITYPNVAYGYKQRTYDFIKAFGPLKLSGYTINPSSSLGLTVAGGTAWADGRNYQVDPNNPSYITDPGTTVSKIFRYYQSGSVFIQDTNGGLGYTVLDPANYNNNGTLTGVSPSTPYTIQRVFWYPNSATKGIVVYYGNAQYTSIATAEANLNYETFNEVENTKQNAIYLGAIIIKYNGAFTNPADYAILPGGIFRSVGGTGGGGSVVTTRLVDLSDVLISGPTDGQPLVYDSTATKWENKSFISASISGNAASATTAVTASSADNFLVRGTLTAQNIVVQTITSSQDFVTGSTKFGTLSSNTHQFTGSVSISGSLTVTDGVVNNLTASYAANADLLDGLDSTQFTLTSSFSAYTASLNNFSASILSYTASNDGTILQLYAETASLKAATASLYQFSSSILNYTSSNNNNIASLYAFSASILSYTASNNATISQLFAETASLKEATASLYAFSASINSFTSSINSYTSSNNAAISQLYNFSSSILSYTASNNDAIAQLYAETASLKAATASLYSFSASINSYTASNNEAIAQLYAETASLKAATSSLYAATASLYAFSASILNFTSSTNAAISQLYAETASLQLATASLSSSIAILSSSFLSASSSFDTRINSLTESVFTHVVTNNGSSNYIIDGIAKPILSFVPGATYRFNTSGVVGTHPFKFSTSPNGPTEYTTGVISGSNYIQIEVNYDTPTTLYYYCTIHSGMGNSIEVLRIENLVSTASFNPFTSSINSATASLSSSIAALSSSFLAFSGSYNTGSFSGSLVGTASWAVNAVTASSADDLLVRGTLTAQTIVVQTITSSVDFVTGSTHFGTIISNTHEFTGSVSVSGSLAVNGSDVILTNQTSSMSVLSAQTASYWSGSIINAESASFASTASFVQNAQSASYWSGSIVNALSASFANNATTASYVQLAQSASYWSGSIINAETASYVQLAQSASYWSGSILNATSASFATTASYWSGSIQNAVSAAFAEIARSASFATTASFALNAGSGGGGGLTALYILDEGNLQGTASYLDFVGAGVTATVTNGTASINIPGGGGGGGQSGGNAILTQSVANTTWSFTHNLGTQYPVFTIYDDNNDVIIPQRINVENTSSAKIYFSTARTGYAVASQGGDITSASYALVANSASYAATASFTPNAIVNAVSNVPNYDQIFFTFGNGNSTTVTVNNVATASLANTASSADNFTVRGTLTAQTLVVQTITSSVVYSSGSNIFGNDLSNTQVFTGSVSITGSLAVNGSNAILTNQTSSMSVATASFVANAQTASFVANAQTASFVANAQTASYVLNAVSSSFAATASFALNAGGGISAISVADEGILQGSASYFDFTGAGVTATISAGTASISITGGGGGTSGLSTFFTQSVAATTWSFTHNLNTRTPLVQVYDSGYNQITPQYISASNGSTVEIGFGIATAGYAVASTGGTLYVTGSNVILDQSSAATTWSFSHNLNTKYPVFQVFNSSDEVVVPEKIIAVDSASALIYFPTPVAGKAVASFAGLSGSAGGTGAGFPFSGSAIITGSLLVSQSFVDFTKASYVTGSLTGSLLGTASYALFALTASTAPGYTVQFTQSVAAATWSFTHNMNTRNPIVQVYDSSYKQIIPNDIIGTSVNDAEIRFDYSTTGYVVMSNGGGLYVTGSTSELNQTSAATTWSFTHNLNSKYVAFEVYDSSDYVIIPAGIKVLDVNSAELYFAAPQTGRAVAQFSGINGAPNATSASFALTASYATTLTLDRALLDYAQVNSSVVGSNNLYTQATGSYTAAFFKYTCASASNARAGEVSAVWNGTTVEFNDVSTNDIGSTSPVTSSVTIVGTDVQFNMQTNTSGWRIKSTATFI